MSLALPIYVLHRQHGREAVHAELRRRGEGDRLDQLLTLLAGHTAALEEVVSLADEWPADLNLVGLRSRALNLLRHIRWSAEMPNLGPDADLGHWGANGQAPVIADMLADARWFAARRAEAMQVAA